MRRGLCKEDNKTTKLMQHPAIEAHGEEGYMCEGRARSLCGVALIFSGSQRLASSPTGD